MGGAVVILCGDTLLGRSPLKLGLLQRLPCAALTLSNCLCGALKRDRYTDLSLGVKVAHRRLYRQAFGQNVY